MLRSLVDNVPCSMIHVDVDDVMVPGCVALTLYAKIELNRTTRPFGSGSDFDFHHLVACSSPCFMRCSSSSPQLQNNPFIGTVYQNQPSSNPCLSGGYKYVLVSHF
jgi:hypothetical protein